MTRMRTPEQGEIQIVTLLGATTFIGWAPAERADSIMDSFERLARIPTEGRADHATHVSIRLETARLLRGPDAERLFTDRLAAACLWLAMRHWSNGEEVRRGVALQMEASGYAVITASIADPAPENTLQDSAWAFMVGSRVHDGRAQLAGQPPHVVKLTVRDDG